MQQPIAPSKLHLPISCPYDQLMTRTGIAEGFESLTVLHRTALNGGRRACAPCLDPQ